MNYKHGMCGSRAYKIWCGIKERRSNRTNRAYQNYGGRGITVCDRWLDFNLFYADMGDPPPNHTLERKDNNKGYSLDNCIWADRTAQGRNKRNNVVITIGDVSRSLSEWVEHFGAVAYPTAWMRIRNGWDAEKAVRSPKPNRKGVPRGTRHRDFDGHQIVNTPTGQVPLWQAIEASGLRHRSVMQRIRRGWGIEAALRLPPKKGQRKAVREFGARHDVTFIDQRGEANAA